MFLSKIGLFSILLIFYRSVIVILTFVKKKKFGKCPCFFPSVLRKKFK